jgi:ABC-type branched-subunit amino acid transport system substrate-binding protein
MAQYLAKDLKLQNAVCSYPDYAYGRGHAEVFKKEFEKVRLTNEEKRARVDIRYKTAAGKHIIIELKKYDAVVKPAH